MRNHYEFDAKAEKGKYAGKTKQQPVSHPCKGCGFPVSLEVDYCGECMSEDDCAPDLQDVLRILEGSNR